MEKRFCDLCGSQITAIDRELYYSEEAKNPTNQDVDAARFTIKPWCKIGPDDCNSSDICKGCVRRMILRYFQIPENIEQYVTALEQIRDILWLNHETGCYHHGKEWNVEMLELIANRVSYALPSLPKIPDTPQGDQP